MRSFSVVDSLFTLALATHINPALANNPTGWQNQTWALAFVHEDIIDVK